MTDGAIHEVKQATITRMGDLWIANYEANRDRIRRGGSVAQLFDRFRGLPAVIVAAGPSLDKTLPILTTLAGKVLIIAVDTIYAGLRRYGVDPDIAITLDPQPDIARFYDGVSTQKRYLVAPSIVSPVALDAWGGDVIFYHKYAPDIPTLTAIARTEPNVGLLIPGGSVLTVGMDLAFRLGCEPIAFIGQDLSYPPGRKAYSNHTIYADYDVAQLPGGDDAPLVEKDIFGRKVETRKNLFVTKQWMEWAFLNLKRPQPCHFFNCTEGGIVTDHCDVIRFAEWAARFGNGASRNLTWEIQKSLRSKKKR